MTAREIDQRIDALFVEGPDDGAVVNALVKKQAGIDLSKHPSRLVRIKEEGGGDGWALREFDAQVKQMQEGGRVGVIVDRDSAENDKWPAVRERLRLLGAEVDTPIEAGAIVGGRYGIWMWPDNVSHGDLETFIARLVPPSAALSYATEVCEVARSVHGAEYELKHARKAALKVRSVWRDARAAGGYGHLIRNLSILESPTHASFLAWFRALFLT